MAAASSAPGSPRRGGLYGEEAFEPGVPGEARRIDYGALAYDPVSRSRLLALGVAPGWRCLDVGAGTGSIARWLAEDIAVAEVVAVDRDTRFLHEAAGPRLTVLAADVSSPSFAPGLFDLVHARFLLMHLRDRADVLRRLAAAVAPGGLLVLSDAIDLTTEQAPESDYRSAMLAMWRALRDDIGTDIRWVPEYPGLLHDEGLTDVGAEVYVPPLTASEPMARFWPDTWERIRPSMVATGLVTDDRIDAAVRAVGSRSFSGMSPGMITAWGRRPL